MSADRIPIPSPAIAVFTALGFDLERIVRLAGIPPSMLAQPKILLTTRQFFAVWQAVETVSGDPDVGLRIGQQARPDRLDLSGVTALHSDTFGDALRCLARYKRLVCPEELRLDVAHGLASLEFRWTRAETPPPKVLLDGIFSGTHTIARLGAGKTITPHHIELARPGRRSAAHEQLFQCDVRLGAERDLLVYHARSLDEPFLTRNPDLVAALLPGLEARLNALLLEQSLDRELSTVLARAIRGGRPSVAAAARELGVSARTLQRRLHELGTSYQAVLDAVRRETARHLLDSTDMAHGEIAFFLGFEEVNSFMRAFQRWERHTPAQWRALHRLGAPPSDLRAGDAGAEL